MVVGVDLLHRGLPRGLPEVLAEGHLSHLDYVGNMLGMWLFLAIWSALPLVIGELHCPFLSYPMP